MKKSLLSIILLSSVSGATASVVDRAEYAEVRGLSAVEGVDGEGWITIYPGVSFRHGMIPNLVSKLWKQPTIFFFDKDGKKIGNGEQLPDSEILANPSNIVKWVQYKAIIKLIRARLSRLPKVYFVRVVQGMKGPERQSIQLFNKKGVLIAYTDFESWGGLQIGDAIPAKAIKQLAEWIRNPEKLNTLKIQNNQKIVNLSAILD